MGKFASLEDVTNRYEGDFPSDREAWVETRIEDVEAALVGLVPSLGVPVDQISEDRARRVTRLVADKVLDLFRNPGGYAQRSQTAGTFSDSSVFQAGVGRFSFTEDELNEVRDKRRGRIGTIPVAPWRAGW